MATTSKVLGTVTSVVGEVKATASDGTTRILQVGDKVFSDEVISTSPTGDVKIALEGGGHTLECGNDSNLALHEGLLGIGTAIATQDSSPVVAPSVAAQQEMAAPGGKPPAGPADVAALQAAIASGADPTQVAEATAAGGAPGAGGAEGGGSHSPVIIEQGSPTQNITSGFVTTGGSIQFPTPEINELPPVEGQPVVSVSVQVQVQVDVENPENPDGGETGGVVVSGNAASLIEGTNSAEGKLVNFIISLDQPFDSDVQVTYTIMPVTASNPSDFFDGPLTQTVTILAGDTQIIVPVTIVQDHFVEGNETFNIVLTDAVNATINPAANTAVVTIVDDDALPVANPDSNWVQEDVIAEGQDAPMASGNVLENQSHPGDPSAVLTFADTTDTDFEALTVSAVNGDAAKVGVDAQGEHGTLTLNSDGSYTYTLNNSDPAVQALDDGETLTDTFTYSVTDGFNAPSSSVLSVTVFGTNDAPVVKADTNWALEDGVDASGNVLQTLAHAGAPSGSFSDVADTDVDGESLSVSAVNGSAANVGADVAGTYGTLHLNANGSYTYVVNDANATVNALDTGESISESFSYTASDGDANSAAANLTITIFGSNDAPVAKADTNWVVEDSEASSQAAGNVLQDLIHGGAPNEGLFQDVADTDVDGESLSVSGVNGSGANVGQAVAGLYGTLTLNSDGTYTYTVNNANLSVQALNDGQTLTDSFNYTASDGTTTAGATLNITIFGSSDGPTAKADTNWAQEDGADASGNVLQTLPHNGAPSGSFGDVADSDTDGDALTVSAVNGSPTNVGADVAGTYGTLHLNADGSYTYVVNDANAAVQSLDTGVTLTDSFTYIASDEDANTASANLTITIFGSNDAPVAVTDTNWALEDGVDASGNVLQTLAHAGAPSGSFSDVADTDVDGESLSVSAVNGSAANVGADVAGTYGTLHLNANGSYTYVVNDANATVNALDTGESISENFSYTASDGDANSTSANLTITIFGSNDAPVAVADTNWALEDGVDASGNVLQTLAHAGAPSGSFSDVADTDVDGESLSVSAVNGSAANVGADVAGTYGTLHLNANGSYTYVVNDANATVNALDTGESISESFSYTASDGDANSTSANLTITIFGSNDAPVAVADTNWALEDGVDASGNVLQTLAHAGAPSGSFSDVADTDVDVETLTVTGVTGGDAYGMLTLNPNGSYSYVLNNGNAAVQGLDSGETLTETYSYTVSDGTTSDTANLTITIFGTNDAPVAAADTNWALEDTHTTASGNVLQTLAHNGAPDMQARGDVADTDADVETLTVTGVTGGDAYGTLTLNPNGSYSYALNNGNAVVQGLDSGETLTETYSYTVSDGTTTDMANLTITIFGTNDAPTITAQTTVRVSEEGLPGGNADAGGSGDTTNVIVQTGTITVADVDMEALTVTLTAPPPGLTSNGVLVTWELINGGHTLVGAAGSTPIVTVTITDGGAYNVTLSGQVDHDTLNVEDEKSFNVGVTVSDGTASANGTLMVIVEDDSPVFTAADHAVVANTANTSVIGDLIASIGADQPGVMSLAGNTPPADLQSGGQAVQYSVDPSNPDVLIAHTGDVGDPVFKLELNSNGTYTFALFKPLDATEVVSIGGGTSFGAGPTQGQILVDTAGTSQLAVLQGWTADAAWSETDFDNWLATGVMNTAHVTQSEVNGSTAGWGIPNNNFNTDEIMRLDFHNYNGFDGSGVPAPFSGPAVSFVTIELVGFTDSEQVAYVTHYEDGTFSSFNGTVEALIGGDNDNIVSLGTAGKLIDHIEFFDVNSGGGGKFQVVDVSTVTNTGMRDLNFNVGIVDEDGDATTGTIGVTVDGSNPLGGTAGNDAIAGDHQGNTLDGLGGNDVLVGSEGNDILTGGTGSDTFKFTGTLTAGNADTVTDFSYAPMASGGDVLNLHDVLQGTSAQNSADPGTLGSHINVQTVGSNTVISVDADGSGGPGAPVQVVTLEGVTGVTLQQLLNNHQIET